MVAETSAAAGQGGRPLLPPQLLLQDAAVRAECAFLTSCTTFGCCVQAAVVAAGEARALAGGQRRASDGELLGREAGPTSIPMIPILSA